MDEAQENQEPDPASPGAWRRGGNRSSVLITPEYLALNRELHSRGSYGISGGKWAAQVDRLMLSVQAESLLDYGCGQGTLKKALRQLNPMIRYRIREYDPAIPGKEEKPLRSDVVVCGDVLEHIEPECLYEVLDDIANIARMKVFLVVATRPAVKTLADGRNAHLIVETAKWWLPKLFDRWHPSAFQDLGGEFIFIGDAH